MSDHGESFYDESAGAVEGVPEPKFSCLLGLLDDSWLDDGGGGESFTDDSFDVFGPVAVFIETFVWGFKHDFAFIFMH